MGWYYVVAVYYLDHRPVGLFGPVDADGRRTVVTRATSATRFATEDDALVARQTADRDNDQTYTAVEMRRF